jgi:hypothetical protein
MRQRWKVFKAACTRPGVYATSTDEAGDRFEICPLSSSGLLKLRTAIETPIETPIETSKSPGRLMTNEVIPTFPDSLFSDSLL